MKKKYSPILLLLLFNFNKIIAQDCLPDGIEFSTQAQIDSFPLSYSDCSYIIGNVRISGNDITNLGGLSSLDSIGGHLLIESNPILVDLDGLENLTSVGYFTFGNGFTGGATGLEIIDNSSLTSLSGLGNLTTAKGCIVVSNNPVLSSLEALENLSSVGLCDFYTDFGTQPPDPSITISNNDELNSLDGLENIDTLKGDVLISGNENLQSLQGMHNIVLLERSLTIEDNASIQTLQGLGNLVSVGDFSISGNSLLISTDGLDNLASINGSLSISDNDVISELDEFQNIDSLSSYLHISGNSILANLDGFENLVYIGKGGPRGNKGLEISNNDALTYLSNLENVDFIEGSLQIFNNEVLLNLDALENVRFVGGCLRIENNNSLSSLTGLNNLDSIGVCVSVTGFPSVTDGLTIVNNPLLSTLDGLGNIDYTTIEMLEIIENQNLCKCHISSICDFFNNGGTADIDGNAVGCNAISEIEANCIDPTDCFTTITNQNSNNNIIKLFPNPTNGIIYAENIDKGQVTVLNSLGELLMKKEFSLSGIDLSELPDGMYFIQIQSGIQSISKRIIKL